MWVFVPEGVSRMSSDFRLVLNFIVRVAEVCSNCLLFWVYFVTVALHNTSPIMSSPFELCHGCLLPVLIALELYFDIQKMSSHMLPNCVHKNMWFSKYSHATAGHLVTNSYNFVTLQCNLFINTPHLWVTNLSPVIAAQWDPASILILNA